MSIALSPLQLKPRLSGLDYLRGLAAFGIMTYHYASWNFGEQAASSFLGRVGIYGVAIFYILSGQTLSYIYNQKLQLVRAVLQDFYKKRFFRIFPLLWLATVLSIAISKHIPNSVDVFLNLTGLFGLIKWDTYFATGAWSIGNELCFYLAFPLLVLLLSKSRIGFYLITLLAVTIYCYFAFAVLHPEAVLSTQWHAYTNPLNQFLFFLGGVAMGKFIQPNSSKTNLSIALGVAGFIAFISLPVHGNAITLVTGPNRLFFLAICLLLCYSFFRPIQAPAFIDKPLLLLGQSSYSLYLLHPLVYAIVKVIFSLAAKIVKVNNLVVVAVSIIGSLIASYLSYHYFERFFIRISRGGSNATPAN